MPHEPLLSTFKGVAAAVARARQSHQRVFTNSQHLMSKRSLLLERRSDGSTPACYFLRLGSFRERKEPHFDLSVTGGAGVIFPSLHQWCHPFLMRLTTILWAAASTLYKRSKLACLLILHDLLSPADKCVPHDSRVSFSSLHTV